MKRIVDTVAIVGSNVMEMQRAITRLVGNARIANGGQKWGGSSSVGVEDQNGQEASYVDLIEETLTDGSKVYDIRILFSNVE